MSTDFTVADIEPDIIGITESWAHKDTVDAELMLPGYAMFRKDRQERMGGGVIMYIKDKNIWCNIAKKTQH